MPPVRRTEGERGEETCLALFRATIRLMLGRGCSRFTTAEAAAAAGVSCGDGRPVLALTAAPVLLLSWWRRALPESPRWLADVGRLPEADVTRAYTAPARLARRRGTA